MSTHFSQVLRLNANAEESSATTNLKNVFACKDIYAIRHSNNSFMLANKFELVRTATLSLHLSKICWAVTGVAAKRMLYLLYESFNVAFDSERRSWLSISLDQSNLASNNRFCYVDVTSIARPSQQGHQKNLPGLRHCLTIAVLVMGNLVPTCISVSRLTKYECTSAKLSAE